MPIIDYLVLGNITHDKTPDGPRLGGTVSYSAVVAQALGLRVGVVTSAHPDDPTLPSLADVAVHLVPAASSTIFINRYNEKGDRTQVVEGQAKVLTLADIPPAWRDAPIVHLGPIAQELDDTLMPASFPGALVGVTPQGYMREWDEQGRVFPRPWRQAPEMLRQSVTILSDEDLGHSDALEAEYAAQAYCLVVTRGYNGATMYRAGQRYDFPAPAIAQLCHPTGAGDTFAAAFFAMLHRHPGQWEYAAEAAVIIASTYVETCLQEGVPTLEDMQTVLQKTRVQAVLNA